MLTTLRYVSAVLLVFLFAAPIPYSAAVSVAILNSVVGRRFLPSWTSHAMRYATSPRLVYATASTKVRRRRKRRRLQAELVRLQSELAYRRELERQHELNSKRSTFIN